MQIRRFENFDLNFKACITWKEGVPIGYRSPGSYYMCLYRLDDFYVEMQYPTCYDVAAIKTFQYEDELEQYLDKIDTTIFV